MIAINHYSLFSLRINIAMWASQYIVP